jgi:antirestriction protein ArdC
MANIAQDITNGIIEQLEKGVIPWVKPWQSKPDEAMPHNPASGTYYKGINFLWLTMMHNGGKYGSSSQWMTYNQAKTLGAQVKRGAKGVQVLFYKKITVADKNSETGSKIVPMLKTYTVFNADFIDGLPEQSITESVTFEESPNCELFVSNSGADIRHGGDKAFYSPAADFIQLPKHSDFNTGADYYGTLLHELSHWTGHDSRLNRDFSQSKKWGDNAYAMEELVAELGSAMLCAHNKIDGKLQHASYIDSWLQVLKSDNRAILKASAEAQKILDYLTDKKVA